MSSLTATPSLLGNLFSLRRFSVAEYHRMIQADILNEEDKVELLEGYVVLEMPRNPPHDSTIQGTQKRLFRLLPSGWDVRIQSAITLADSEPEPDLTIVRGDETTYRTRHPTPADIGVVVEVANSSLDRERIDQGRIYARASIPIYWIVNLVDGQVEVYLAPAGPTAMPTYAQRQDYPRGTNVPLGLGGVTVASVPVTDLLP
jgi:Uma2 family endonuclease